MRDTKIFLGTFLAILYGIIIFIGIIDIIQDGFGLSVIFVTFPAGLILFPIMDLIGDLFMDLIGVPLLGLEWLAFLVAALINGWLLYVIGNLLQKVITIVFLVLRNFFRNLF